MVCMDGFLLTHAVEEVELPEQQVVDDFLPPFIPARCSTPRHRCRSALGRPRGLHGGQVSGASAKQMQALEVIPGIAAEYGRATGRVRDGLISSYRLDDADTAVVALGSVLGTAADAVDELREEGHRVGLLGITSFRPFPLLRVRHALAHVKRVVVLEKNLAVGIGGVVSTNVRTAMGDHPVPLYSVIAGLGGRPIPTASLRNMMLAAEQETLEPLTFLDLRTGA